jgi:arsenate reductase
MALPDGPLLLHNPRCSKSRAAKALLEQRGARVEGGRKKEGPRNRAERGARFELRLYLEAPLSRAELTELRRRLARPAREWVRRGEPAFSAVGLGPESDDDAVLAAIAEHPELLERPILVRGERAVVGRPPENVLDLL